MKADKMKYIKIVFMCSVSLLIFQSCHDKIFESERELTAYISNIDNGYAQQKSINGIDYSITYRPTDLIVQQELKGNTTQKYIDSLRKKYNRHMYFNVVISSHNQEVLNTLSASRSEFGTMVNQLAFGMSDKVHVISKAKDTIAMTDYIYPRFFGMGGGTSMLFIYPKENLVMKDNFFHFTIEDIGLNTGDVSFKIPTSAIKEEPRLALY